MIFLFCWTLYNNNIPRQYNIQGCEHGLMHICLWPYVGVHPMLMCTIYTGTMFGKLKTLYSVNERHVIPDIILRIPSDFSIVPLQALQ